MKAKERENLFVVFAKKETKKNGQKLRKDQSEQNKTDNTMEK